LPCFWAELGLQPGAYFVVTLHRPANVDGEQQLLRLLHAISAGTQGLPVVFPVHPRTAKNLRELEGQIPARVGRKSGFIAPSAVCWHSADNAGKKPPAHPPYAGWLAALRSQCRRDVCLYER